MNRSYSDLFEGASSPKPNAYGDEKENNVHEADPFGSKPNDTSLENQIDDYVNQEVEGFLENHDEY